MQFRSEYEGPWASCRDIIVTRTAEWRFQRPVTKVGKCRKCGWCSIFCPIGCVEAKERCFEANLEYCKGCGICAKVCPANAVKLVREEA